MSELVILRIGGSSISYSRYLDLLEHPDISELILIVQQGDKMIEGVISACKYARTTDTCNRLKIYEYAPPANVRRVSGILWRAQRLPYIYRKLSNLLERMIGFLLRCTTFEALKRTIEIHRPDFVWSGSNDFDGSNLTTWWAAEQELDVPIVRSYKEHRCRFLCDEKNALLQSDALILPSQRNVEALEAIYSVRLKDRTVIADEDWRYSKLIEYVRAQEVEKLSCTDGEPHVVILSGVATYGTGDVRRYSRYNYLTIIKELVRTGVHVHMHVKSIIETTQHPVTDPTNPYVRLADTYRRFHIEPPLDLERNWGDYLTLKRYDAGILHNFVEGEPIAEFTRINIPNRLYEYQICDVLPIVVRDTMLDVEDILRKTGFGIIASTYPEAGETLKEMIDKRQYPRLSAPVASFRDFTDALLSAFHLACGSGQNMYESAGEQGMNPAISTEV